MTEIVRGDGMKYALEYNAFHNLESIGIEGKEESLIKYTYKNGNGRLKEMTYANGDTMKATYNSTGQMIGEKWLDKNGVEIARYKYVYDGEGNIVRSIDIFGKKEYNYIYDAGKLIRAIECNITLSGEAITSRSTVCTIYYSYDSEGQLAKKTITQAAAGERVIHYSNSDNNSVVQFAIKDPYSYDETAKLQITAHSKTDNFGRKEFDEIQTGTNVISRQFTYHSGSIGSVHEEEHKVKSSPTTQLVSRITLSSGVTLAYEYDKEERITSVVESYIVDGFPVSTYTAYTYDELGQLLTETVNGTLINKLEYDNYGNIKKKNNKEYIYDRVWKDQLIQIGYGENNTISYDAQGNPTTYLGHTLTWEKGRQLKSFDSNTYTYNANGIRTSKTVNGVKHEYVLDGTKILSETWDDNTLVPMYDNEDSVCGIIYRNIPYYFLKNQQGDVISISCYVNGVFQVVARYSYDI